MKGVEEQHRDVGPLLQQHVREDNALGLKARRDARLAGCRESGSDDTACRLDDLAPIPDPRSLIPGTHVSISSIAFRTSSAASSSDEDRRARSEEHTSEIQYPCNLVC